MATDPALAGSDADAADLRQAWKAAAAGDIDAVVEACVRTGLIDDGRYVEAKAASGRRRGWSARRIAATLKAHGVDDGLVRAGLDAEDDEAEIAAAMRLIVRRRIGPAARPGSVRDRHKDLATVMRGGFSGAVARQALERVSKERQADDEAEPGDDADETATSAPGDDGAPDDAGARRDGRRQGRGPSQRW
ncbi:RecX family transcriptional regulator [Methylobrevis sp. L22]|uniref:Regulatory protein RecX n=2 Tax=Methylobrevis albus TaxID=2793297 RepID=A0A931I4P1_9HYPH|nr:RecX family transcriptional regulator [Methylobrevis albus]